MNQIAQDFDYKSLDVETRIVVRQRTDEIRTMVRRTAQDIIEIGNKLIDVKECLGHGNFGAWLDAEFGWSYPTANRFMLVADAFKSITVIDLNMHAKALYLLSAPSTPEPARLAAVERAAQGETITHATAQQIVREYKSTVPAYVPQPVVADDEQDEQDDLPDYVTVVDPHGHEETVSLPPGASWKITPSPLPPTAPVAPAMAVHFSSETPEHYTPAEIIAAAIACMGGIDLDPCSNSHQAPNVPAATHYTAADDGLAQRWFGCVYMNPPYGREIEEWVDKLVNEYEHGSVTEAIALVPSRTDTQWWLKLREYHVCFVEGRLKFLGSGKGEPAPFPSAVFYLGGDTDSFVAAFEPIGDIWHRTRHGYCLGE